MAKDRPLYRRQVLCNKIAGKTIKKVHNIDGWMILEYTDRTWIDTSDHVFDKETNRSAIAKLVKAGLADNDEASESALIGLRKSLKHSQEYLADLRARVKAQEKYILDTEKSIMELEVSQ